ncbi:MAG: class I SAM-dependent methyltransferase [Chloroflexi bacterium]|nr:class I SAM-dependent methyltransferase [Chloroflexota bacterium]
MTAQPEDRSARTDDIWRGTDFSGLTVVLGLGAGQLVRILAEQIERNDGTLLVINDQREELRQFLQAAERGPWTLIQAQSRHIPVLTETVDLLVVNGVLRQIPEPRLPTVFEEFWRVLVPGGQLRISDILEPSEASYNAAWRERNRLIILLSEALGAGAATGVNIKRAALAARSAGFDSLSVTILPGYGLTDAWLEETIEAVRAMASRVVDSFLRQQILDQGLSRLVAAYRQGEQRGAERFVLKGVRAGDLALTMEASFTEDDLLDSD